MSILDWFGPLARLPSRGRRAPGVRSLKVVQSTVRGACLSLATAGSGTLSIALGTKPLRIGPGRLQFTDNVSRSHAAQVAKMRRLRRRSNDNAELQNLVAPVLLSWARRRLHFDVLELGPAYSTTVAETLAGRLRSYLAIDFSAPFLQRQAELLSQIPALRGRCSQIVANTYDVVLPNNGFDLVVTSCHPPFVSAPVQDKIAVIDKVHAALRAGGTFALFPWHFDEQQPEVTEHLLKRFVLREIAFQHEKRFILMLEKRC